ncbi:hypothetical protein GCM10023093_11780 [Nemorincola caseinilytica]|uniref:Secretion system C-terminal sorting domain-containing protein n=1 Tax=Nemorincola caseinilytica TaxID=2054315 RepID=A0ABP8N928_9BACT
MNARHTQMVSQLLQLNTGHNVAMKSTAVPTQRVIAQSTRDNILVSYTDSVLLRYTGMRKSKYDYNNMIYAYNYAYSTTPMFNYAGIFNTPQVQYDTFVHWTINPFTMPAFNLYEGNFATHNTDHNIVHFTQLFVDSATNDNRSFANTFTATKKIGKGCWFNLNAGVEDSAMIQYFSYDASDRLKADSIYERHLGVWRIAAKSYYTYDAGGNLVTIDHYANVSDTSFLLPLVQQSKYVNTYDASNRLTSVYTSMHDGTTLSPYVKDTFGYSGTLTYHNSWRQHQFDEIHGTWWPQYRMTKHIASGKPDTIYHDGWDSILNMWTPISKDIASYNTYGDPDTLQNYLYNWTSYSISPDYTTVYYYETFSDTTPVAVKHTAIANTGNVTIFPNPAHSTISVQCSGMAGAGSHLRLTIYNMQGQAIMRHAITDPARTEVPVGVLAAGMYWVLVDDPATQQRYGQCRFVKE